MVMAPLFILKDFRGHPQLALAGSILGSTVHSLSGAFVQPGQLAESSSGSSPSLTSLDGSLYQTKPAVLVTIRSVGYMEAEILDLVGSISLLPAYFGAVCPSLPKP